MKSYISNPAFCSHFQFGFTINCHCLIPQFTVGTGLVPRLWGMVRVAAAAMLISLQTFRKRTQQNWPGSEGSRQTRHTTEGSEIRALRDGSLPDGP